MNEKKIIELKGVSKSFDGELILDNIDLKVYEKEFMTLLGPSGCGKTTTLRIIAGFVTPDDGELLFDGAKINDLPPYKRSVNTVFQKYALFPHLNVYENIAFALRLKKTPEEEIYERVEEMLTMVNLRGFEKRDVNLLSGGQQQRVAIARALMLSPKILCFDEPTSALDPELTGEVLKVLRELAEKNITRIIVTHEMNFAREISDKVVFMADGVIAEEGAPEELFLNPQTPRLRAFLAKTE